MVVRCTASLPTLWFMFDQKWVEVDPRDYMFEYEEDACILFVLPVNSAMNIIGMPFFVGYYSIHDPITGVITMGPHTTSAKSTIRTGSLPTQYLALGAMQQVD